MPCRGSAHIKKIAGVTDDARFVNILAGDADVGGGCPRRILRMF